MGDTEQPDVPVADVETPQTDTEGTETEGLDETQTTDQPEGESESEDQFFDPTNIPQELVPAYKQMQAAFTKKTQEIASKRKELEYLDNARPVLERLYAPENKWLYDVLAGAGNQAPQQAQSPYPTDPIAYAEWVKEQTKAELARDADFKEAENSDPRLNSDPTFQSMALGIVNNNPDYQAGKISAAEATKQAVMTIDQFYGQAKKEGKIELSQATSDKAKKYASPKGSEASVVSDGSPKNMHEAAKQAMEELGIS